MVSSSTTGGRWQIWCGMRKVSSCGVSSESESLESLVDLTCRGDAGVTGFDGRLASDMIGTSMSTGSVVHRVLKARLGSSPLRELPV
ncbi:hypothetical protein L6452_02088 [Arctium lappa]|uniref:Uncharacterized protein n=1 Tax=Arctium lappa TaxID=4217 RepID=A0ACB9FIH0_ARCLA|nr:hypothetical protein L6452_02088 [Arctium lappa]